MKSNNRKLLVIHASRISDCKRFLLRRSEMFIVGYAEVASVKKLGQGLSAATWVIIGAAVTAGIVIGATVVKPVVCDGGAQSRGCANALRRDTRGQEQPEVKRRTSSCCLLLLPDHEGLLFTG
jgi:hypothetical protein